MISKGESEEAGSEKEGDGHLIKGRPERELLKPAGSKILTTKGKHGFLIYTSVSIQHTGHRTK